MNRKVWSLEEKLSVVLELLKGGSLIMEICQRHRVSAPQVYRWRDMFLEGGKKALSDGRTKQGRDPYVEENRRLKELVGNLSLIIDAQKKVLGH
jgi:transposase